MSTSGLTFLCIASYEKGFDFLRAAKELGNRVILFTSKSLENVNWPKESIDEIFFIPDENKLWNMQDLIYAVSYLARSEKIDRIVALDDFDVEKAAALREHLRIPGMGDTTARYFRDKLAMRTRAKEEEINVPEFIHVLNYAELKSFFKRVEPPYILKPRMQAGAIGIKKIEREEQFWKIIDELGDQQSFYLLEQFITGDIYHVDSIRYKNEVVFARASKYGKPPFEVAHTGKVFTSSTLKRGSLEEDHLRTINRQVLNAMGLVKGISHSEFIKADKDGKLYFLETSARVGGANLAEMVEAATGINLWREWAKIESLTGENQKYVLPEYKNDHSGIMICLAKQEWPDLSQFDAPEVIWKLNKKYHAGMIVRSESCERVEELMSDYTQRLYEQYLTTRPMGDSPSN